MASDSFQRRNSHGYRNTATSRTTSWNNCEHREIKKLLSEQQLVSAWNTTFFESRGKKQISEVPFLHCAAQLFGASLRTYNSSMRQFLGKYSNTSTGKMVRMAPPLVGMLYRERLSFHLMKSLHLYFHVVKVKYIVYDDEDNDGSSSIPTTIT